MLINDESVIQRKRITYRISKRANLELEALLTNFWRYHGDTLTPEQLHELERFLEMDDLDILEMILGKKTIPSEAWVKLIESIRDAWEMRNVKPSY